ncbi:hypothetical protein PFUGPA_01355 [Plasmodium falciparum Palo Alto/Uganda]|uniref:Uncharacterized protein n=2 Tax=Plasmodium falciparum TaxID=5833 RepID=W4J2X0_PLAFP|nr:hypothetical protein PFUGPA_01355 [Plasmodium falciparum Palo Alto/Uganda]ETW61395.1 hypothetical protein PFMC_02815 [Plasmodium falciparum CAMP/Malaysia]
MMFFNLNKDSNKNDDFSLESTSNNFGSKEMNIIPDVINRDTKGILNDHLVTRGDKIGEENHMNKNYCFSDSPSNGIDEKVKSLEMDYVLKSSINKVGSNSIVLSKDEEEVFYGNNEDISVLNNNNNNNITKSHEETSVHNLSMKNDSNKIQNDKIGNMVQFNRSIVPISNDEYMKQNECHMNICKDDNINYEEKKDNYPINTISYNKNFNLDEINKNYNNEMNKKEPFHDDVIDKEKKNFEKFSFSKGFQKDALEADDKYQINKNEYDDCIPKYNDNIYKMVEQDAGNVHSNNRDQNSNEPMNENKQPIVRNKLLDELNYSNKKSHSSLFDDKEKMIDISLIADRAKKNIFPEMISHSNNIHTNFEMTSTKHEMNSDYITKEEDDKYTFHTLKERIEDNKYNMDDTYKELNLEHDNNVLDEYNSRNSSDEIDQIFSKYKIEVSNLSKYFDFHKTGKKENSEINLDNDKENNNNNNMKIKENDSKNDSENDSKNDKENDNDFNINKRYNSNNVKDMLDYYIKGSDNTINKVLTYVYPSNFTSNYNDYILKEEEKDEEEKEKKKKKEKLKGEETRQDYHDDYDKQSQMSLNNLNESSNIVINETNYITEDVLKDILNMKEEKISFEYFRNCFNDLNYDIKVSDIHLLYNCIREHQQQNNINIKNEDIEEKKNVNNSSNTNNVDDHYITVQDIRSYIIERNSKNNNYYNEIIKMVVHFNNILLLMLNNNETEMKDKILFELLSLKFASIFNDILQLDNNFDNLIKHLNEIIKLILCEDSKKKNLRNIISTYLNSQKILIHKNDMLSELNKTTHKKMKKKINNEKEITKEKKKKLNIINEKEYEKDGVNQFVDESTNEEERDSDNTTLNDKTKSDNKSSKKKESNTKLVYSCDEMKRKFRKNSKAKKNKKKRSTSHINLHNTTEINNAQTDTQNNTRNLTKDIIMNEIKNTKEICKNENLKKEQNTTCSKKKKKRTSTPFSKEFIITSDVDSNEKSNDEKNNSVQGHNTEQVPLTNIIDNINEIKENVIQTTTKNFEEKKEHVDENSKESQKSNEIKKISENIYIENKKKIEIINCTINNKNKENNKRVIEIKKQAVPLKRNDKSVNSMDIKKVAQFKNNNNNNNKHFMKSIPNYIFKKDIEEEIERKNINFENRTYNSNHIKHQIPHINSPYFNDYMKRFSSINNGILRQDLYPISQKNNNNTNMIQNERVNYILPSLNKNLSNSNNHNNNNINYMNNVDKYISANHEQIPLHNMTINNEFHKMSNTNVNINKNNEIRRSMQPFQQNIYDNQHYYYYNNPHILSNNNINNINNIHEMKANNYLRNNEQIYKNLMMKNANPKYYNTEYQYNSLLQNENKIPFISSSSKRIADQIHIHKNICDHLTSGNIYNGKKEVPLPFDTKALIFNQNKKELFESCTNANIVEKSQKITSTSSKENIELSSEQKVNRENTILENGNEINVNREDTISEKRDEKNVNRGDTIIENGNDKSVNINKNIIYKDDSNVIYRNNMRKATPFEGKRYSISYNRMMTPNLYTGFKRNINNINYKNNFLLSSNVSKCSNRYVSSKSDVHSLKKPNGKLINENMKPSKFEKDSLFTLNLEKNDTQYNENTKNEMNKKSPYTRFTEIFTDKLKNFTLGNRKSFRSSTVHGTVSSYKNIDDDEKEKNYKGDQSFNKKNDQKEGGKEEENYKNDEDMENLNEKQKHEIEKQIEEQTNEEQKNNKVDDNLIKSSNLKTFIDHLNFFQSKCKANKGFMANIHEKKQNHEYVNQKNGNDDKYDNNKMEDNMMKLNECNNESGKANNANEKENNNNNNNNSNNMNKYYLSNLKKNGEKMNKTNDIFNNIRNGLSNAINSEKGNDIKNGNNYINVSNNRNNVNVSHSHNDHMKRANYMINSNKTVNFDSEFSKNLWNSNNNTLNTYNMNVQNFNINNKKNSNVQVLNNIGQSSFNDQHVNSQIGTLNNKMGEFFFPFQKRHSTLHSRSSIKNTLDNDKKKIANLKIKENDMIMYDINRNANSFSNENKHIFINEKVSSMSQNNKEFHPNVCNNNKSISNNNNTNTYMNEYNNMKRNTFFTNPFTEGEQVQNNNRNVDINNNEYLNKTKLASCGNYSSFKEKITSIHKNIVPTKNFYLFNSQDKSNHNCILKTCSLHKNNVTEDEYENKINNEKGENLMKDTKNLYHDNENNHISSNFVNSYKQQSSSNNMKVMQCEDENNLSIEQIMKIPGVKLGRNYIQDMDICSDWLKFNDYDKKVIEESLKNSLADKNYQNFLDTTQFKNTFFSNM